MKIKKILVFILILMIGITLSFFIYSKIEFYKLRGDSGFDVDYDSSWDNDSSWDSDSSWDNDSSWSNYSWWDNSYHDNKYKSYHNTYNQDNDKIYNDSDI